MNIIKLQGDIEKRNGIYYEYDADAVPLGEGGMGRVFKGFLVVERTGERKPIAIKAIYDNIPERVVERARREASIQLDNENLIRMYGFVETLSIYDGGTKCKVHYHVIMELLVGVTLEDIMNGVTSDHDGIPIPYAAEIHSQYIKDRSAAVIRIMKPILFGLMALHDKGYIHRDIDPSNIMITKEGKIKLIDFGICKQIVSLESHDKALTATGVFMGKVNYAAPELVLGDVKSQNYTTDIYALGILLYQLCAGHLPFNGTDQDILSANLRSAIPMKDVHNKNLRKVIRKATEKLQSKRYSSVAEMRVDIERLSSNNKRASGESKTSLVIFSVVALITLFVGIGLAICKHLNIDKDNAASVIQPTCQELYSEAISLVNQKDSTHLYTKGKEQLRILAEDSLYTPAKTQYYVILINSTNPDDVRKGYNGLEQIAREDSLNSTAMFECGLTLSKGTRYFSVPTIRQSLLDIDDDLVKANEWLYKSMAADTNDYRSAYWALSNLIERKVDNTLPLSEDKLIRTTYKAFKKRVEKHNNSIAETYKRAIKDDEITLRNWNLIK